MTELKTMKDLNSFVESGNEFIQDELRQEAIKWVKALEGEKMGFCNECEGGPFACGDHRTKAKWIKHFFNIAEEELK